MNRLFTAVTGLALTLLLAACAPIGPAPTTESWPSAPSNSPSAPVPPNEERDRQSQPPVYEEKDDREAVTIAPDEEPSSGSNSAVSGLLREGWQLEELGEHDRALAVAERAQRIDPRNPETYLLMATAQFSLYETAAAEQLARRGLSLSRVGTVVNRQLQSLLNRIAAAR